MASTTAVWKTPRKSPCRLCKACDVGECICCPSGCSVDPDDWVGEFCFLCAGQRHRIYRKLYGELEWDDEAGGLRLKITDGDSSE